MGLAQVEELQQGCGRSEVGVCGIGVAPVEKGMGQEFGFGEGFKEGRGGIFIREHAGFGEA